MSDRDCVILPTTKRDPTTKVLYNAVFPLPIWSTWSSALKQSGIGLARSIWVFGSGREGLPWSASIGLSTRIFLTCQINSRSDRVAKWSKSHGKSIVYWSSRRSSWSRRIRCSDLVWSGFYPICTWSSWLLLVSGWLKTLQRSSRGPIGWVEVL